MGSRQRNAAVKEVLHTRRLILLLIVVFFCLHCDERCLLDVNKNNAKMCWKKRRMKWCERSNPLPKLLRNTFELRTPKMHATLWGKNDPWREHFCTSYRRTHTPTIKLPINQRSMTTTTTTLVVGCTGATGKHVVLQLLQQKQHVRAIARSKERLLALLDEISPNASTEYADNESVQFGAIRICGIIVVLD